MIISISIIISITEMISTGSSANGFGIRGLTGSPRSSRNQTYAERARAARARGGAAVRWRTLSRFAVASTRSPRMTVPS